MFQYFHFAVVRIFFLFYYFRCSKYFNSTVVVATVFCYSLLYSILNSTVSLRIEFSSSNHIEIEIKSHNINVTHKEVIQTSQC